MSPLATLPLLIGHRGARDDAPENTLAGLREAARQGAAWVEIDVTLSRDGVPILMHDDDLDRTTDGQGPVNDRDWAEISRLDAGRWFGPAFAGEPVPSLATYLTLVLHLGLGINLEIKPCAGRDAETAARALDVARSIWPAMRPPPLISSFSVASLKAARDLAADWPRGYLMETLADPWSIVADEIGALALHIDHEELDAAKVAAIQRTGRKVLAYTVNDVARARLLFDWGVAALFTDRPAALAAGLGSGSGA
ncbi:MAG: glycerophosphodiester phosphodiesterase [Azospirillaceae bacterium]|nr:glycerophosphodiester phosphodiesterase [Azospirillaceae bacterium]